MTVFTLLLSFWQAVRPEGLEHAECKSSVQANVFSLVTEGWKPEFRENDRQNVHESNYKKERLVRINESWTIRHSETIVKKDQEASQW